MNWFNTIRKWFFNEKKVGIINIGDLIQIPGRDYFKEQDKLDLIDKYKERYLRSFNSNNIINSIDLSDNQEEIVMYIDLLLKIVLNHNNEIYSEIKMSKLDNEVNMYKLRLYLNRMEVLEKLNIAMLIALKELEEGKRVPRKSRNALRAKIDSLTYNLAIFIGQKRAINTEIDTYLSNISISDDNISAEDRLKELIDIASIYIKIDDILKMDVKTEVKIATIENRMEIFCYKNKNLKEEILKEQENISNIVYSNDYYNREEILNQLNILQKKYEILLKYGYKTVTNEELYKFYELKFHVLTLDALGINYDALEAGREEIYSTNYTYTNREAETYKNILQKKIEEIITGRNLIFWNQYHDSSFLSSNWSRAIEAFEKYLKDDNSYYDFDKILYDINRLSLILAFDTKDGLDKFFNKKIISNYYHPNLLEDEDSVIYYGKYVPLSTLLTVSNPKKINRGLYDLFHLRKNNKEKDKYSLPEGIISIDASNKTFGYYAKKVRKEVNGKVVYLPSTLEEITGDLFKDTEVKDIVLNDGIESVSAGALMSRSDNIKSFRIPASLSYCEPGSINLVGCEEIIIGDYDTSNIFTEKNLLNGILCNAEFNIEKKEWYSGNIAITQMAIVKPKSIKSIALEKDGNIVETIPLKEEEVGVSWLFDDEFEKGELEKLYIDGYIDTIKKKIKKSKMQKNKSKKKAV